MKKKYSSPEFDYLKIQLSTAIMGDSKPETIKEDGEVIDDNW